MNDKFISCSTIHFIYNMQEFIDIEFTNNLEYIIKSNKALILWNPYSHEILLKLWNYFRYNNLPSYFVERGALPNTVFVDGNGFLVDSSSYNEKNWNKPLSFEQEKEISNYIAQLKTDSSSLEWQNSGRISKEDFFKKLHLSNDKKIIFVPLQLEGDSVIRYWGDWVHTVDIFKKVITDFKQAGVS